MYTISPVFILRNQIDYQSLYLRGWFVQDITLLDIYVSSRVVMELMAPEEYQERQDQRWSPLLVLQCLHVCCTKWQGVIFVSGRPRVWRPPWSSWRKRAQGEFEDGNGGCGGRAVGLQTSLKLQSGTSTKALTLSLQQIWGWRAVQRLPPAISCALQIWQISEPTTSH